MKYLLLILPLLAYSQTYELEKIVVGSKRDIVEADYTGDVDSISDFISAGNQKVLDTLQDLPGVIVSQSGPPGQQASIFIRGSEARHILVLINGVRVNDPANPEKTFNGALLNVGDIEKIEVLKGPQTLLYGSDAIGGVVNIVTRKGGARNFWQAYSGFSHGLVLDNTFAFGNTLVHANFFTEESQGVSAAASGSEKDGFENKGATVNLSQGFSENFDGEWSYKVLDQFVETDTLDFTTFIPVDADDNYSKSIQQIFSQRLNYEQGLSKFTFLLGGNKVNRSNKTDGSVINFNAFESTTELHWKRKIENGSFLLGLENISETFSQSGVDEKAAGLTSIVFIVDSREGDWFWNYGYRTGAHTQFGSFIAPGFGVGKDLGRQRLSLNYQNGFKSPTLYQLYGPDFGAFVVGNTDLDPETSNYVDLNYQVGQLLNASLFYNRIDGLIQYDSSLGYINSIFTETYGLDASSTFSFGKNIVRPGLFLAHYNLSSGDEPLRRPSEKMTMTYERRVSDSQRFVADFIWSGKAYDLLGGEVVTLDPYQVVNVHYEVRDGADALLRLGIENLFNESYQQVFGYSSQPFTVYLDMKFYY